MNIVSYRNKVYEKHESSRMTPISQSSVKHFFRQGGAVVFPESYKSCDFNGSKYPSTVEFFFDFEKTFVSCKFWGADRLIKILRGGNIKFINCEFILDKNQKLAEITAGARNILFQNCLFKFLKKRKPLFDVVIGAWSIWNMSPLRPFSYGVIFNNCRTSGAKNIRAISLYAAKAEVYNSPVKAYAFPRFIIAPIWYGIRLINNVFKKRIPPAVNKVSKEEFNA